MEEGNIVSWLVKEGDAVKPGDVLAEVETDKATMDLESFHTGILLHIGVKEGPVPVDGIIAIIGEKGDDVEALLKKAEADNPKKEGEEEEEEEEEEEDQEKEETKDSKKEDASESSSVEPKVKKDASPAPAKTAPAAAPMSGDFKASPLAKKIASEKGIALHQIKGSGEGGRIIKRDVENFSGSGGSAGVALPLMPDVQYGDIPVSQMRKIIAKRLGESKFSAPHFYLTTEINMDNAISARKAINSDEGVKVSFNDLIVKASAVALRKHPMVNASWHGDKMTVHKDINIGVAVAVAEGLVVPVLHSVDAMSLNEINAQVRELAKKSREKKIQPAEMQGNTFTISNLGMFDIDEFTAIINPPDACILAVGSIVKKAIVKDDQLAIGNIMKVTLSCDHRIVDGVTGAKFLQTLKFLLENPIRIYV